MSHGNHKTRRHAPSRAMASRDLGYTKLSRTQRYASHGVQSDNQYFKTAAEIIAAATIGAALTAVFLLRLAQYS